MTWRHLVALIGAGLAAGLVAGALQLELVRLASSFVAGTVLGAALMLWSRQRLLRWLTRNAYVAGAKWARDHPEQVRKLSELANRAPGPGA